MRTPQEIAEEMRRLKQRFNTNDMVYEGTLEDLKSQYLTSEQEADAKLEQLIAQADTAFEAWSGIDIAGNRDLDALIDEVSQLTITGTPPPPPPPPPATVPPEYLALVDAVQAVYANGTARWWLGQAGNFGGGEVKRLLGDLKAATEAVEQLGA